MLPETQSPSVTLTPNMSQASPTTSVPHKTPFLNDAHQRIASYFLGGQAENLDFFKKMFMKALDDHADARRSYHPEDPSFITQQIQASDTFKRGLRVLGREFDNLSQLLNEYSIPFYSPRYAGHMCFETSMPAILGWLLTVMFNPNNISIEASPITTGLELDVGAQLCRMLGYSTDINESNVVAWGHIACDGTVANIESVWAARNLKFYPLSLREAMNIDGPLAFIASTFTINPCSTNELTLYQNLSSWDLLNLNVSDILDIPTRLQAQYGITSQFLEEALKPYLVQTVGKESLEAKYGINQPMQYLISSTKHYSWPKAAAVVGIGSDNMVNIPVDNDARLDLNKLEEALEDRYQRRQPVYAVVAIIGSTEEGAVDPLEGIIKLRNKYRTKGMSFVIHADAAWGGYFATMIRDPPNTSKSRNGHSKSAFVPSMTLRKTTSDQFYALKDADSITIDPHKTGYIPLPAGGLCYRDGRMRHLLTWTAPYVSQGSQGESIGIYGIEGSKPGAPAAAVWLHHAVVGLHREGHGMLMGEVSFTCTRLSAVWAALSDDKTAFIVVPFNPLVKEPDQEGVQEEKQLIRERILRKSNEEVVQDEEAMIELRALGSDLNINVFACNFRINGKVNDDVEEANNLNSRIFQRLSVTSMHERPIDTPLYLSSTTFKMEDYGECCDNYKRRLGLETESQQDLFVLRNVCMNPFQTSGDFVEKMAYIFQGVLEQEMQAVVKLNTVTPQTHSFVIQGTDKLYLVYEPRFHRANGRYQLIVTVDVPVDAMGYLMEHRISGEVLRLQTEFPQTLDEIIQDGGFDGVLMADNIDLNGFKLSVTNLRVIKNRPLNSKYRDRLYPNMLPFYLYGTKEQQHIDHILVRAPNAQLSADQVSLNLYSPATPQEPITLDERLIAEGLVLIVEDRYEVALQPFEDSAPPQKSFFRPGVTFHVSIYRDPKEATAMGPGLASVNPQDLLATGSMELKAGVSSVWVDYTDLNWDFRAGDNRSSYRGAANGKKTDVDISISGTPGGLRLQAGFSSGRMNQAVRNEWREFVGQRLSSN